MKYAIVIYLLIVTFIFQSCEKQSKAGLGGNANLKIQAQHHGQRLDSITIYIKFNAQDAPIEYDITQKVNTSGIDSGFAIFKGLKIGQYYILAKGWDPSISKEVIGGIPYQVNDEIDLNIIVPVTEEH